MKRITQFIASIMVAIATMFSLSAPLVLADTPVSDACNAIAAGDACNQGTGPSVAGIIRTVVSILSIVVGIIAVIMIIVSGLKYITSGGDASSVSGAKNTLIYALVGLFVAGSAQFIVNYVMANVK